MVFGFVIVRALRFIQHSFLLPVIILKLSFCDAWAATYEAFASDEARELFSVLVDIHAFVIVSKRMLSWYKRFSPQAMELSPCLTPAGALYGTRTLQHHFQNKKWKYRKLNESIENWMGVTPTCRCDNVPVQRHSQWELIAHPKVSHRIQETILPQTKWVQTVQMSNRDQCPSPL